MTANRLAGLIVIMLLMVLPVYFVPKGFAFQSGQAASLVIGQSSFTTGTLATTQDGMSFLGAVAFDSNGNLWVCDSFNNRVLEFSPPFTIGMSASLVIGQSSFTTSTSATSQTGLYDPAGMAFDPTGNLWVSDVQNNRVLEYIPPFSNGMPASLVVGQPDFTTSTFTTTQSGLDGPLELAFDSHGDLWVADASNSRVLEYVPPFATGMSASLVIGQSSFTTQLRLPPSQTGLNQATGIAFDSGGNLWVADKENNRTLEYIPPFSNGMPANLVIGQSSFMTGTGTSTQSGLLQPHYVSIANGNLWTSEGEFVNNGQAYGGDNRVLEYLPPFTNGMSASLVIGQSSFTTSGALTAGQSSTPPTQTSLNNPVGISFDSGSNLWVADSYHHRVLEFGGASAASDFGISNSGSVSALQGSSVSNELAVTYAGGTTQTVTLSVTGLPAGTSVSFSGGCSGAPTCSASPTFSTTLTLSTISTTPVGTYPISVKGTSSSTTHVTTFNLLVYGQWPPPATTPWPMFHHDLAHSGRSPYNGSQGNTEKWNYFAASPVSSSPTIGSNGTIYVGVLGGTMSGLLAVNPQGTLKWNYYTGSGNTVYSSPALGPNGTIYFESYGDFYAINPDGTSKWFLNYIGGGSSPVVGSDGTIYVGSYFSGLFAINPNGSLKWNFGHNGIPTLVSSPAIGPDGTVYIGAQDHNLYAVNPADGSKKWNYTTGSTVWNPTVGPDGTVFLGSDDSNLYAINPDGTLKWKYNTGNFVRTTPAVGSDGTVYVASGQGTLWAINSNGTLKWSLSVGGSSSPVIGLDGTLYIGSGNDIVAINPAGTLKWRFTTGGPVESSPAIDSDGTIYIGSGDYNLYAVNGSLKGWDVTNSNSIFASSTTPGVDTIKVWSVGMGVQSVSLSCSGLPSGATCTFSPPSGIGTFSSQLTITVASSTVPGSYSFVVTGSNGTSTQIADVPLLIGPATVGGTIVPVNKIALLAPYIELLLIVLTPTTWVVYFLRSRRTKPSHD